LVMKNIILGTVVLVGLLLVGFYMFNTYIYNEKQSTVVPPSGLTGEKEISGVVTAVNREEIIFDGPVLIELETAVGEPFTIAVPSMGFLMCAAAPNIADVYDIVPGDKLSVRGTSDEAGKIVPCENPSHYLQVSGVYVDLEVGFRFEYPKGPDGYLAKGEGFTFSDHPTFVSGVMLVNKNEDAVMEENTEPREGPPTIQFLAYENTEKQSPAVWADAHPRETNSNLRLSSSELQEISVGGAPAVQFVTDGLYAARVYVVTHGDYILVMRGEYLDTDSEIYRTFTNSIDTFEFVP